jgi:hypothetical protein
LLLWNKLKSLLLDLWKKSRLLLIWYTLINCLSWYEKYFLKNTSKENKLRKKILDICVFYNYILKRIFFLFVQIFIDAKVKEHIYLHKISFKMIEFLPTMFTKKKKFKFLFFLLHSFHVWSMTQIKHTAAFKKNWHRTKIVCIVAIPLSRWNRQD